MGLVSSLVSSESQKGRVSFSLFHLYIHPSSVQNVCPNLLGNNVFSAWTCLPFHIAPERWWNLHPWRYWDFRQRNLIKVGSALSKDWTRWPLEVSPNLNYSVTVREIKSIFISMKVRLILLIFSAKKTEVNSQHQTALKKESAITGMSHKAKKQYINE